MNKFDQARLGSINLSAVDRVRSASPIYGRLCCWYVDSQFFLGTLGVGSFSTLPVDNSLVQGNSPRFFDGFAVYQTLKLR